jgi:integrase
MATISKISRKTGTSYKVRIRKPNSPTVTKTFSSKNFAQKWARKTELEIEEGTYFDKVEAASHTVTDLVDRYINEELRKLSETDWPSRKRQLNWWKDEIGKLTLNKVTPALIVAHRKKLAEGTTYRNKPRSGSTINRYLAAFSAALGIAASEWQWISSNPFASVRREKENDGRVRFLSSEERTALLEACEKSRNKTLYLITLLALSTGMRQTEIMSLTWDQIDFERKVITLYKTKNGEIRVLPLVGFVANKLKNHCKIRSLKNPYVFAGRHQTYAQFPRGAWESALERAEITNFKFHDCRHSAASELAMNGASLHEIAAVLGHKTLAMVQRYAHLSEQHTTSVVERMNKAVFGDQ